MPRMIIVEATEEVACPKCSHAFALSEGISRQAIERHAEDFDRSLAQRTKELEAGLAAEAKRRADREAAQQVGALKEALAAAEAAAKAQKAQLEKAREQAAAQAREAFELELKSAKEALAAKDDVLQKFRTDELALRRQLR